MKNDTSSGIWWLLLVGMVSLLLCVPFFRTFYALADEGIFLRGAELMLQGKRLYADFFEFYPPGSFILIAAWLGIAGISIEAARSLALLTIVGISCLTFLATRRVSRNAPLSALLVIGWVLMTQWHFMQINHHWFTTFFSMVAVWAAFAGLEQAGPRSLRWPILAGMAAGAATMTTQTCGAWAMLAAATAFFHTGPTRRELVAFVSGSALVFAGILAFLIQHHSLAAAFDDVILFPLMHYAAIQYVPFGYETVPLDLPLKYVFPLTALLLLFVVARDWRNSLHDSRLRLSAAFALAGFLACFPRPDSAHIAYAIPLALPLLALCAVRLTEPLRPFSRYAVAAMMILLCTPSVIGYGVSVRTALEAPTVQTSRGLASLLLFTDGMPELLPILAKTAPQDGFFFYPHMPVLSFMAAREHVSKYDVFVPWYTTAAQYEDGCLSAVRDASWVVIDRRYTDYNFFKRTFPAMPNAKPPETIRLEKALDQAFEHVTTKGAFEVRRRRPDTNADVCDGIAKSGS
jgi:hypothetical protein